MTTQESANQIPGATYRSTDDIMNIYRAASPNAPLLSKEERDFCSLLSQAKKQHGCKLEKIEMVFRYHAFEDEQQETRAFSFLLERLED
jgi:chaperone required for assembly of F1-ATPase